MEYYPAIKRNELFIHATTCMDLKIVMLKANQRVHIMELYLYTILENANKSLMKADQCRGQGEAGRGNCKGT